MAAKKRCVCRNKRGQIKACRKGMKKTCHKVRRHRRR